MGVKRFLMKKSLCPQALLGQIWSIDEIMRGVDDLNNEIVGGMTFLLEIVEGELFSLYNRLPSDVIDYCMHCSVSRFNVIDYAHTVIDYRHNFN